MQTENIENCALEQPCKQFYCPSIKMLAVVSDKCWSMLQCCHGSYLGLNMRDATHGCYNWAAVANHICLIAAGVSCLYDGFLEERWILNTLELTSLMFQPFRAPRHEIISCNKWLLHDMGIAQKVESNIEKSLLQWVSSMDRRCLSQRNDSCCAGHDAHLQVGQYSIVKSFVEVYCSKFEERIGLGPYKRGNKSQFIGSKMRRGGKAVDWMVLLQAKV